MAWIGAVLVGLSLGLLGSGGSILTVPVLIYLVGEPDKVAIAESLGIVGLISLAGLIPFAYNRQVDWRSVIFFGLPGMAGTYGGAWLAEFVSGAFQLILFALVMVGAAIIMYRDEPSYDPGKAGSHPWWKIGMEGTLVGILTGMVGVGGGFLIVPALVVLGGLPIHLAVGTSLAIITLKSASGFVKYIDVMQNLDLSMDWQLIGLFALLGAAGSYLGRYLGQLISPNRLKRGFAVFLLLMAVYILYMNI